MNKYIYIVIVSSIFSLQVAAKDYFPIGGVYLDSFTGVSAKAGLRYGMNKDGSIKRLIKRSTKWSPNFLYSDVELGTEAKKLNFGIGRAEPFVISRVGFSIAEKDSDKYFGIEGLVVLLGFTFKAGAYHNTNNNNEYFSLGFGFGI